MTLELKKFARQLGEEGYTKEGQFVDEVADYLSQTGVPPRFHMQELCAERISNWEVFKTFKSGEKSRETLKRELEEKKIVISDRAIDVMWGNDFMVSYPSEQIEAVRLKVRDLGFTKRSEIGAIFQRVRVDYPELGLFRPDDPVSLRLAYDDQPLGDELIAMTDPMNSVYASVFKLTNLYSKLGLRVWYADPVYDWLPNENLAFRLRK